MGAIADLDRYTTRHNRPHNMRWSVVVPIGAAGATGTLLQGPPGLAVANSGTGIYAVTGMPVAMAASSGKSRPKSQLYSPALTVTECTITARDFNAGTMTFTTTKAGTPANPASGDEIAWEFEGESE